MWMGFIKTVFTSAVSKRYKNINVVCVFTDTVLNSLNAEEYVSYMYSSVLHKRIGIFLK